MQKLKHRATGEVAQAHMASKRQSQESKPGHLTQGPMLLFFTPHQQLAKFFWKGQLVNISGIVHQQAKLAYYVDIYIAF